MQTLLVIALLAGPAWDQQESEITLDAAQKASWETATASLAPGLAAVGIRQLHCVRTAVTRCRIKQLRAGTFVDFDSAEINAAARGRRIIFVTESKGIVTWVWVSKFVDVTGAKLAKLATWAATVWPGVPLGKVKWFTVGRRPDGDVTANLEWSNGGTRAKYLTARKAGVVKRRNGSE